MKVSHYYAGKKIAILRSLLALSMIINLLFTNNKYLFFEPSLIQNANTLSKIFNFNYFALFYEYNHIILGTVLAVAIMCWVISGYLPQLSALFHWWIALSFTHSSYIIEGGDQLASNLCFLVIPLCLLDPRSNQWVNVNNPHPFKSTFIEYFLKSWIFLIRFQISFVYISSAIAKSNSEYWQNGSGLYYWFNGNTFGLHPHLLQVINPLLVNPALGILVSLGIVIIEFFIGVAVLLPNQHHKRALQMGVVLHVLFALCFGLPAFSIVMIAGLMFTFRRFRGENFSSKINDYATTKIY